MDELDRRRQPHGMGALVSAEPRARERQQGAHPLAPGGDQMRGDLGNQVGRGIELVGQNRIDRAHIGTHEVHYPVKRLFARPVQRHHAGHRCPSFTQCPL